MEEKLEKTKKIEKKNSHIILSARNKFWCLFWQMCLHLFIHLTFIEPCARHDPRPWEYNMNKTEQQQQKSMPSMSSIMYKKEHFKNQKLYHILHICSL